MYSVYILQSEKNGSYYIGYSHDVFARLATHNAGLVTATRYKRPYRIVYTEGYEIETDARKREYFIKRQKSRVFIEKLIEGGYLPAGRQGAPRLCHRGVSQVRVVARPPVDVSREYLYC